MINVMQVCGARNPGGAEAHFLRFCIELNKFSDVRVIPVVRKNSWLADQFKLSDLQAYQLPFVSRHDFWTRRQLKLIALKEHTQISQCWMSRASSLMPKVTGVKNLGRLGGYYGLKNFRAMDWLVGATADLSQHIIQGGHAENRTATIPNFVNAAPEENPQHSTELRQQLNLAGKRVLFTPARLHQVKGLDTALDALTRLSENVVYIIAGQGPEEASLKQKAASLGLENRVIFTGWTNDISQYCYICDAFLVPSRHEPFGSVLLEAWSHQKPLISSDSQGARAIATDGENALIFPRDNSARLAEQVTSVLSDQELATRLAERGYAEFQAHYTAQSVLSAYIDLYHKMLP